MPFNDRTAEHISTLDPRLAPRALQFINGLRAAGIPAYISSSLRTASQQADLVRRGLSRTAQSKHLSGRAFDWDILGWNRDNIPKWVYVILGEYGEALGMNWGGRWTNPYDAGHFEI